MIQLGSDQNIAPGAPDIAVGAINFFKPSRSLLDALVFALSPGLDVGPTPSDALTLGGIVSYQLDVSPGPSDAGFSIAISLFPSPDSYGPAAPLYSGHYFHSGITYGMNQPAVADSALIVNGNAVLQGG